MHFFGAFDETESAAKLIVKLVCGVSHDIQPAALDRSLRTERAHDDVPAGFDRLSHCSNVVPAVFGGREEMEDGTIVP